MNKKVIIPVGIGLIVVIAALLFLTLHQHHEMAEMVEQMTFEKEQLEDEYEELAIQFDGYQTPDIHNDSLVELLSREQQRVQDLLEELRITKVTNARRIAELKKELATVRQVMVGYVHQIDSLNHINLRLTQENKAVKEQYRQVSKQAEQLQRQNTEMTEVISRASMLEVEAFNVIRLNKRDRKTTIYNQIQKLEFDFTLSRNITCERGMKMVYLRLTRPDGEVMQKSVNNVFHYENAEIAYSVKKEIEYEGEPISDALYWTVEEILQIGLYNADFFVDGALIGSFPFEIKK